MLSRKFWKFWKFTAQISVFYRFTGRGTWSCGKKWYGQYGGDRTVSDASVDRSYFHVLQSMRCSVTVHTFRLIPVLSRVHENQSVQLGWVAVTAEFRDYIILVM